MAQAGLTVRRTCRADTKVEHSEPTFRIRCGWRLTDKSYSRDNRLVPPKSSYRRRSSAPRCRLTLSWGWRRSQGYGCSPFKKVRELGSNRLVIEFTRSKVIYYWRSRGFDCRIVWTPEVHVILRNSKEILMNMSVIYAQLFPHACTIGTAWTKITAEIWEIQKFLRSEICN